MRKPFKTLIVEGGPLAIYVYRPDTSKPYIEFQALTHGGWLDSSNRLYDNVSEIMIYINSLTDELIEE